MATPRFSQKATKFTIFAEKNARCPVLFQRLFKILVLTLSSTIELFTLDYSTKNKAIWLENESIKNLIINVTITIERMHSKVFFNNYEYLPEVSQNLSQVSIWFERGISGILIHIPETSNYSFGNILLRNKGGYQ